MFELLCNSQISTSVDGYPVCSTGWLSVPYSALFPPLSLSDMWALCSAVIALWALAFAFRATRKSIDPRM